MYSIMAMGVAASMYFFLKRNLWGYVIATLIALYSHHFAIFAIFVQGVWFIKEFLVGNKVTAKRMFGGYGLYADGVIDREEADFLFSINDVVSGNKNSPAWK